MKVLNKKNNKYKRIDNQNNVNKKVNKKENKTSDNSLYNIIPSSIKDIFSSFTVQSKNIIDKTNQRRNHASRS